MLPLFKEYISFLNEKTNNKLDFLKEGYYWYDNSIIKAYDIFGAVNKIARIKIDDDLNLDVNIYSNQILLLESWNETASRHSDRLSKLETESLNLIKKYKSEFSDRRLAILSSGGKDSSVVSHITRKHNSDVEIIFNNTSLDCADTYLHIQKEKNLKIINPKEGFYQWRDRLNFIPTRFARACCNIFKESSMVEALDSSSKYLFCMGMRNEESSTRKDYKDKWKNEKWSNMEWDAILPIRKWTELDVWLYILKEGISINPKYKKGYSRVGCAISCPFYSKSTWILDKYWYPKMKERWDKILIEDFRKNNKDLIMNCTEKEYLTCWNGGPLRDTPTDEVISQFASRNGLDYNIAKKYFGHKCSECNKPIKHKDTIAMNLKFNGRNATTMFCKKHLIEALNIDNSQWDYMCNTFKGQGCELF